MMPKLPQFLHTLLTADADSREYRQAEEQLQRRPELQTALEQLAMGDTNWWREAQSLLSETELSCDGDGEENSSILIEIESALGDDAPVDFERVKLDFLAPPTHPELLGRLGRYEIERVLGTGGMGVVLRAFDTELHRVVAVKVLAPHLANHSSARRRFSREAQAAAAVVHPHVIPIFNVESEADVPYLVMQYVAGKSLQWRVDHQGPLSVVDALRIAQQTAAGLSAAHSQGLVHRDVKPANILMLEENVEHVLLSDFGLARAVDDASLTKTGIVAGTPHYMSPEQALGESIDHRSDLFSLGSVLYFMLAGRPPFRATGAMAVLHRICQTDHRPLIDVNREVPLEVSRFTDQLLAKSPDDRIQSALNAEIELAQLLHQLQSGGLSLRTIGSRAPLKWQTTMLVGVVLLSLSLIAMAVWHRVSGSPRDSLSPDREAFSRRAAVEPSFQSTDKPSPLPSTPEANSKLAEQSINSHRQDAEFYDQVNQIQAAIWQLSNAPNAVVSQDQFEMQTQWLQRNIQQLSSELK